MLLAFDLGDERGFNTLESFLLVLLECLRFK